MIFETKLPQFLPKIEQLLDQKNALDKPHVVNKDFLIQTEGKLELYYAPHNEYLNMDAAIVIVGITPGWNQMKEAYQRLQQSIRTETELHEILKSTKVAASFSGQMRQNLINMLDQIGLAELLGLSTTAQLFTNKRALLHTTSVIRYPVFKSGKNYTGHAPSIENSHLLTTYAYGVFKRELHQLKKSALVIPLGKAVENTIQHLQKQHATINHHTYLFGFPHPSGANGHRKQQFHLQKEKLQKIVDNWAAQNITIQ